MATGTVTSSGTSAWPAGWENGKSFAPAEAIMTKATIHEVMDLR
jgi:hypothetical protein